MSFEIVDSKYVWLSQDKIIGRLDFDFYAPIQLNNDNKVMNFDKFERLSSIVDKKRSEPQTKSTDYCEEGIDVIRMGDLSPFEINLTETVKIPKEIYNELKEFTLKAGMVIFGLTGVTLGQVCIVPKNIRPSITNRRIAQLEIKNEYDPYYIGTYLNTRYGQLQLFRYSTGVAQPNLRLGDTDEVLIPIPSKEIQNYIGDKVRRAEELREEADIIERDAFKKFNDIYSNELTDTYKFQWIKSKLLDIQNSSPIFYNQYDLLLDKKNEYIELKNIIKSIKSGIPVKKDERKGDEYPFYGASGVTDVIGSYNFDGEYLVIAQDGSVGCANVARGKFWANNHVWLVQLKNQWDLEFVELYLKKFNYWASLTTGSVVPKVTSENLKRLLVPKIKYELQVNIGKLSRQAKANRATSVDLIQEAKQDVEDLIEGTFDTSLVNENTTESR